MTWKTFGKLALVLTTLVLPATALAAEGDNWPEPGRTMEIIVPYAAGGGVDFGARVMAENLEKQLGISVVVVNKPGGGSQVGLTELSRAAPDGYTLGYVVLPTVVTHYLDPKRQAAYTRDSFTKIAVHFASQYVISVLSSSPFKTLTDLVDAARAKPGEVTIGDAGVMTAPHIVAAELAHQAGVEFSSIHYAGGAPALAALRNGEVQALATGGTDTKAYLETGEVRVLGVATAGESTILPGQPTMREQGYDVVGDSLTGIIAPKGVPQPVVDKLVSAIRTVIESDDQVEILTKRGVIPDFQDPEAFDKLWMEYETRLKTILPALTGNQ